MEDQRKYLPLLLLAFAILLGAFMRLYAAWQAGFPIVDGGMFLVMARDLQASHYLLPSVTSYNNIQIPFAYPPLGLYLLAGLNGLFGLSLTALLQWLPAILSALTIPAFFLLARRILGSGARAALATLIFALTPQAYEWQLMGGGLTRSLGALFAILTIFFSIRLFQEKHTRLLIGTILLGALTVYSHPEWALQAATACFLGWWFYGRNKTGTLQTLAIVLGILLLTSPWWLTVVLRHGARIFLLASQTPQGRWLFWWPLLNLSFSGATNLLVVGLGLVGIFVCLKTRQYFLPVWLVACFLVDLRSASHVVPIQMSLLATLTLAGLFFPWLVRSTRNKSGNALAFPSITHPLIRIFMGFLLVSLLINAFTSVINLSSHNTLAPPDRQAMQWVRQNTPLDGRFLVLGWKDSPWVSPLIEWFPALAERQSLTTVQGREWLAGDQNVNPWIDTFEDAQGCLYQTIACLDDWSARHALPFDYVYLSLQNSSANATIELSSLYQSINASPNYELVYDAPSVKIYRRH